MPDYLKSKIRGIRWRLRGLRSFEWACHSLFWALSIATGLVVVARLFALEFDVWRLVMLLVAGGVLAGALLGAFRGVTPFRAALLADDRLGLRERLSSALTLPSGHDPMVRALHTDAQEHARRLRSRDAVPLSFPRRAKVLPVPAAALLLVGLLLPQLDLLHLRSGREAVQVEKREIEEQATRLEAAQKKAAVAQEVRPATAVAKLSQEIKRISEELKKEKLDRTQALAKVSSLSDKLDEQRRNLVERIGVARQMQSPHTFGQLRDFARSLSDQDFEKASGELKKLAQDLEAGELTDSQKASLAADVERMAALLHSNPELSRALADMARSLRADDIGALNLSLDDALASLADLKDILEQLALLDAVLQDVNLSKLALAGRISSCTACQACGKCGPCGGSGKCPGCGGSGKDGQGGSCSSCGGSGICPFCQGIGVCAGCGGVGLGAGVGLGPRPTDDSILTSFLDTRIEGRLQPGKILAAIRVKGQQVRGESQVEVVAAFHELRQSAEQALSKESIPSGMKDRVRDYFDAIAPYVPAPPVEGGVARNGDVHP